MDLWNPLSQLETTFYSRCAPAAQGFMIHDPYAYHNHVLMGCNLWVVQRTLKPAEAGKYRLVLIQGTRNGRMRGMTLNADSEVHGSVVASNIEGVPSNAEKYLIEVTGVSHMDGHTTTCQLITLSQEIYTLWLEKLKKAKCSRDIMEASGEAEKLRTLARRMREGLVIRQHLSRFRFYARTFTGPNAVQWLAKDKQCTPTQAAHIANRLLNLGLLHHVTYEHIFCVTGNLLYRFSYEIDPFVATQSSRLSGAPTAVTVDMLAEENHRLLASYHTAQQETVRLRAFVTSIAGTLPDCAASLRSSHDEQGARQSRSRLTAGAGVVTTAVLVIAQQHWGTDISAVVALLVAVCVLWTFQSGGEKGETTVRAAAALHQLEALAARVKVWEDSGAATDDEEEDDLLGADLAPRSSLEDDNEDEVRAAPVVGSSPSRR